MEELRQQITASLDRVSAWLDTMQAQDAPTGVCRFSASHDPAEWPGVLLPGTYNAVLCRALLGEQQSDADRQAVAAFLTRFRRADGVFRIPEAQDADVHKKDDLVETWAYIDNHTTNYALGALQALGALEPPELSFAQPYLDPVYLANWLATRDLAETWLEGNNVVNVASFLLLLRDRDASDQSRQASEAIATLLDWHDTHQDPVTGFWCATGPKTPAQHLHAMAGATHNLHLYYATDHPVGHFKVMVDYCLSLDPAASTACLDVDPVDILCALHARHDYRRAEIVDWLRRKLIAVLAFQNPDGGFADARDGTLRLVGWVNGYAEPQGVSNTFGTWFRVIAIAMIARTLWPSWREWRFRSMIGIGYAPPPLTAPAP